MTLTSLRVINDEQTAPIGARDATEPYEQTFDDREIERLAVTRKGRHLNVDEVLARSLPKLTDKGRNSVQEKNLAEI